MQKDEDWFGQLRTALQPAETQVQLQDTSYLTENDLIGNPEITFADLKVLHCKEYGYKIGGSYIEIIKTGKRRAN